MSSRSHGLKLAATKARQVAIRRLGLQQTYTVAELQKPFLIYRTIFTPDLTNPEIAKMYAAHHMGMANAARALLYPSASVNQDALPQPQPPAGTIDAEAKTPSPASTTASAPRQPLLIVAVNDVTTLQTGEIVVEIVGSDGTKARTTNTGIATQARGFMKAKEPLDDFRVEPSPSAPGKYRVIEIVPVRAVESDDDKY